MGEYAIRKSDNERVKIGTCKSMYYLRYEDRGNVQAEAGNVDPVAEADELRFRLPFPDEDHMDIGEYPPFRGVKLVGFEPLEEFAENPGILQFRDEKFGLMANVKCRHGMELPKGNDDVKFFWHGKDPNMFNLVFVRPSDEGMRGIVACRSCNKMFWQPLRDLLPYVLDEELKERLEQYE